MTEFYVRVMSPDAAATTDIALECDTQEEALRLAREVRSPFGHELRAGGRFLGRFEQAWGAWHVGEEQTHRRAGQPSPMVSRRPRRRRR